MLAILRTLTEEQRDVIAYISLVGACLVFLLGYSLKMITDSMEPKVETWPDVINLMPDNVREHVAIAYCVENPATCRTFPLSSPIMEGKAK